MFRSIYIHLQYFEFMVPQPRADLEQKREKGKEIGERKERDTYTQKETNERMNNNEKGKRRNKVTGKEMKLEEEKQDRKKARKTNMSFPFSV